MRACAECGEWVGDAYASCRHCGVDMAAPAPPDAPRPDLAPELPTGWDQYTGRYVAPRKRRGKQPPDVAEG